MGRRRRDEPRLKRSWGGTGPTSAHSEPAGGRCPRPPRGGRGRGGEPTTTPQPALTPRHSAQTFPRSDRTAPDRTGPDRPRSAPRAPPPTAARNRRPPNGRALAPFPAPPFPSGGGSVPGPGCEGSSAGERARRRVAIGSRPSFPWGFFVFCPVGGCGRAARWGGGARSVRKRPGGTAKSGERLPETRRLPETHHLPSSGEASPL